MKLTWDDIEEVEAIVRMSLKWFINRSDNTNHNQIIDELDLI